MSKLVSEILDAAADLIEPEGKWAGHDCKGRYCASTAISNVTDREALRWSFNQQVTSFLARHLGGHDRYYIWAWNDAPERTQAEVVAKLREAAELARSQGQ